MARGLEADAVYQDLKASILPGVTLGPGMVLAIEQAQRAGLTYHRQYVPRSRGLKVSTSQRVVSLGSRDLRP